MGLTFRATRGRFVTEMITACMVCAGVLSGGQETKEADGVLGAVESPLLERIVVWQRRLAVGPADGLPVVGYVEAQRALLARQMEKEGEADQVVLRLAAANWELGAGAARPVSRILFGLETGGEREDLSGIVAEAGSHLEKVESLIEKAELKGEKAEEVSQARSALEAFGGALAFLAEGPGEDEAEVRKVLTSTAVLLEDDRPAVRAAAEVYQAYVLARTGKVDRGLAILPLVLAAPPSEGLQFSLGGKLLRLRLLAGRGQGTAAWSLALRAEERSNKWAGSRAAGEILNRSFLLSRLQALSALQADAGKRNDAETARWADTQRKAILEDEFSEDRTIVVFGLKTAIPILVEPPERPKIVSIFEVPTAASAIVFVMDLSARVPEVQRREIHRKVCLGCEKLAEGQRFGMVSAGEYTATRFGDKALQVASEETCRAASEWLAEQPAVARPDLGAALEQAGQLKPMQLIVVTDRSTEGRWLKSVGGTASKAKAHVDLIQVGPAVDEKARNAIESLGGRYRQIELAKVPVASKPTTAPAEASKTTQPASKPAGRGATSGPTDKE